MNGTHLTSISPLAFNLFSCSFKVFVYIYVNHQEKCFLYADMVKLSHLEPIITINLALIAVKKNYPLHYSKLNCYSTHLVCRHYIWISIKHKDSFLFQVKWCTQWIIFEGYCNKWKGYFHFHVMNENKWMDMGTKVHLSFFSSS